MSRALFVCRGHCEDFGQKRTGGLQLNKGLLLKTLAQSEAGSRPRLLAELKVSDHRKLRTMSCRFPARELGALTACHLLGNRDALRQGKAGRKRRNPRPAELFADDVGRMRLVVPKTADSSSGGG